MWRIFKGVVEKRLLIVAVFLSLAFASSLQAAVQSHEPLVSSVKPRTARIWTRTDSAARVRVEYSTRPSLNGAASTNSKNTSAATDFTEKFTMSGLAPLTRYYYRVMVDGVAAQVRPYPSFVTSPPQGTSTDFSFAVVADLINTRTRPEIPAPAYTALAEDAPAFVLQIGDLDHRNPGTLTAMRSMRKATRGPESAAGDDWAWEIAPNFPVYYVWDDHDYGMDNGDKTHAGRANALQVYREYFPTVLPNPNAGVWHSIEYGDVEIFMLDARSQRDRYNAPEGPNKSMLDGDNIPNGQEDWLLDALATSAARWKVLISPVPFKSDAKPDDGWAAYITERQELLDLIDDNNIENVFVVSADLHTGGAIDDGTNADLPEISVPHTNLQTNKAASGPAGEWSHGMTSGSAGGGYALLTFSSATGDVLMEVKDEVGNVRHAMTLQSADSQGSSFTLNPTDDVFVSQSGSTQESWQRLRTDVSSGAKKRSFLRFDASGISGNVISAVLRLYVHTDANNGAFEVVELRNANTWKNLPGNTWTWGDGYFWCGPTQVASGSCRTTGSSPSEWICGDGEDCSSSFVEIDVADLVTGDGDNALMFGLQQRSGAVAMSSNDDGSNVRRRPTLTIETGVD